MEPKRAERVTLREERTKKGRLIMKKIILLLAIMLMASPALAAVNITVTDAGDGSGWATIAYAEGETDFVRAFALDITAADANIVEIDSISADYWVFPGSIDINDEGLVEDQGSPVAPSSYPGTLGGLDTNGITIEMGALFEVGVDPEPGATGTLLRIRVDATSEVCVAENSIRGGVVMKDPSATPTVGLECQMVTVSAVVPCPWDVDGNGWINQLDRNAIINYLNVNALPPFYSIATPPGDENYDVDGNGWINQLDRNAVINYLNVNALPPFYSVLCP